MKFAAAFKINFLLYFLLSGPLYSQLSLRSGFATLENFGSARLLALGSISSAHPGDVSFSALNPACLNESQKGEWSITSQASVGGLSQGSLTVGVPFPKKIFKIKPSEKRILNAQKGGISLKPSDIFVSLGVDYINSGLLDQRNAAGELLGSFTAREIMPRMALSAKYGQFSLGLGIKLPIISYGSFTAQAISTDYAFQWSGDSARKQIVILLRNVGWNFEYFASQSERLPINLQISFSQKLKHAPFRYNITYSNIQRWDLKYLDPQLLVKDPLTGIVSYTNLPWYNNLFRHVTPSVEAQLGGRLYFQLGYDFRRQMENRLTTRRVSAGVSTGITFKAGKNNFQYGSSLYNVAGRINQFSLIRKF